MKTRHNVYFNSYVLTSIKTMVACGMYPSTSYAVNEICKKGYEITFLHSTPKLTPLAALTMRLARVLANRGW